MKFWEVMLDKMVLIKHPQHPRGAYYMEKALYENLIELPKRIKKDKDVLFFVVGSPGTGKSTLNQQIQYFLDKTFDIDRVLFSFEDYIKKSIKMFEEGNSEGKGIMHDEGKESLSALTTTSKRTRNFMKYLFENRQMNMYQGINLGDFFDVPKSIVMQRLQFMVWVHEAGEFDNGFFKFFNKKHSRLLYLKGKKRRDMRASSYSFRGKFPKFYTVDEDKYRSLKKSHLTRERYIDEPKRDMINDKQFLKAAFDRLMDYNKLNISKFCRTFGISQSNFYHVKSEYEEEFGEL